MKRILQRAALQTKEFIQDGLEKLGFQLIRVAVARELHSRPDVNLNGLREDLWSTAKGVLHIGAHRGQEAELYESSGARVLWVEANPVLFDDLSRKLERFPSQSAILQLLGDSERETRFHIASNDGSSSSIYRFAESNGFSLEMVKTISAPMRRLDATIDVKTVGNFPHWVLDVQGAELPVLKGAGKLLDYCFSLDIEISTYSVYEDAPAFTELDDFLTSRGFISLWKPKQQSHEMLLYFRVGLNID